MAVDLAREMLPAAPRGDEMPSDEYVRAFRDSMIDRYRQRNDDFTTLVNAWHGTYTALYQRALDMDSAGRPILRINERGGQGTPTTINIYKGFVDAYRRMLVSLPDARLRPKHGKFQNDLAGQKQSEAWGERARRAAYGIWAASQMEIQQVDGAWWKTNCGSHGSVVLPDFERGHAKIHYVAPWDIYGVRKLGDPVALTRAVITSEEDLLTIEAAFPDKARGSANRPRNDLTGAGTTADMATRGKLRSMQHTIFVDEGWFIRMIGDEVVFRDYHGLGFCPALITPLIRLPGYANRGHSVAEQTIPMQLSINYADSLWEAGMKDSIFKTAWVKDPINVPDNWARGKGMLITMSADGAVGEFGGDPQALKMVKDHFDFMRTAMELNTGVSRAAQTGQLSGGGPTTGRGIDRSLGPYLAAIEEIQIVERVFKARELTYALRMTANAEFWEDGPDATVEFEGTVRIRGDHQRSASETFTRAEIAEMSDPEIIFAPMAHLSLHERVNIALQLYNTKPAVLSWQKIIELTALEDDIELLRSQIESDNAWRVEIMKQEVAARQPAPPPDAQQQAASVDAGVSNPTTMARAGLTTPPAQPTPAAGAPVSGPPAPATPPLGGEAGDGADGAAPAVTPEMLQQLAGGPPDAPKGAPTVDVTSDMGTMLGQQLGSLALKGDVYFDGKKVYVADWKDKSTVKSALAGHKDLGVTVLPKGVVPQNAKKIASAGGGPAARKGGGRGARNNVGQ